MQADYPNPVAGGVRAAVELRAVFDAVAAFIAVLTPDGVVIDTNRPALGERLLLTENLIGQAFEHAPWWSGSETYRARIRAAVDSARAGISSRFEIIASLRNGARLPIDVSFAPVAASDGEIAYIVASAVDERARRRLEKTLAESERQMRLMADSMPQLVWTTRPDGFHEYFNRRWYEYTGTSAEESAGDRWVNAVHPADRDRVLDEWRGCVHTGQPYEMEYRVRRASDGCYRWFLSRAVPVRDTSGKVVRWFGTSTDIQDQKEYQAALKQSNEDLEQFAFAASHDLQEPLRMVAIYSQLLKRRYARKLDGGADLYIDQIVNGAQRMETLLHDLRGYMQAANIQGQHKVLARADANDVMAQVLANTEALIEQSGADVTVGKLPVVAAEPVHLGQVLQNLLSNAIKYRNEAAPSVQVFAQRTGMEWLFSVTDNGIGIEERYQRQIFGVFKRLHGQKYPGTGIGLALCLKIVERYGGTIWVKSELGRGSTFFFTMPAVEETY